MAPMISHGLRATLFFLLFAAVVATTAVIFRVIVPDLIDAHDDLLAFLGVLAAVGGLIVEGWLILLLWLLARRFTRETPPTENDQ